MNPAQTLTHFRLWGAACKANGWRTRKGRLDLSATTSKFSGQIVEWAQQFARDEHRAPAVEDLRHACYMVAAGKKSSRQLNTTSHVDRLFALLRLLIDDSDIDAAIKFGDQAEGIRARLIHRIKESPFPYVDHICSCQFAGRYTRPYWEDLPTADLANLVKTLSARTHRWKTPIPTPAPELVPATDDDNNPF